MMTLKNWTWKQWLAAAVCLAVVFAVVGFFVGWWMAAGLGAVTTTLSTKAVFDAMDNEVKRQNLEEQAKMKRTILAMRQETANKIANDVPVFEIGSPDEARDALLDAAREAKESRGPGESPP